MKTPEQLKGTIRHIAQQKNLRAQEVLQMYFFERILVRLASSGYRQNFILKGGLLISSIIGISERTTMDMDTIVRGIPMEEKEIISVVTEIISLDVEDGIAFEFQSIEPIRDDDAYNNFRVHVLAKYGKIRAPMKIDITTGDVITPSAIEYSYPLSFEKRVINIFAYSLESVIAEKYETIIRRSIGTTRMRDFYDLDMIYRHHRDEIDFELLRDAVLNTAEKRKSLDAIRNWREVFDAVKGDSYLHNLWKHYAKEYSWAENLTFSDVLKTVETIACGIGL